MAANNCGIALHELGRLDEAVAHYRSALQIKPNFADAHNNCAAALRLLGRYKEALTHYRKAVRIKPNFAKAHRNLSWLLATCPDKTIRDGRQALAHAERARRLFGEFGDKVSAIQESLAASHAELGDFEKAVRSQERAAQFAPEAEKEKAAARLKLYKQGKPYRDSK
jgi:tetratricopeptide (TPR) repeat protein